MVNSIRLRIGVIIVQMITWLVDFGTHIGCISGWFISVVLIQYRDFVLIPTRPGLGRRACFM